MAIVERFKDKYRLIAPSSLKAFAIALMALGLTGCTTTNNNYPLSDSLGQVAPQPSKYEVFIDKDGTFYPKNWRQVVSQSALEATYSLYGAATPDQRVAIDNDEQRQLSEIANYVKGKKRVYILTHGYNNDEAKAVRPFELIERQLNLTDEDAVIRVFWDGRLGENGGQVPIWFNATAYSGVVGSRGVRPILNLLRGQEVIMISHSRGASVLLSSLSNPTYDTKFVKGTSELNFRPPNDFLTPAPIGENGNKFHLIFLAAAIGYSDFYGDCKQGQTTPCYRDFTDQLKSIHYTINDDEVLQKFVQPLSSHFNASNFGRDKQVGATISARYPSILHEKELRQQHRSHDFVRYAQDPEFKEILDEILINKN